MEAFVAEGLHWEFKDTIDSLAYMPSTVESQLNQRGLGGPMLITADEAARSCLAQLGHTPSTNGNYRHEMQAWQIGCVSKAGFAQRAIFKALCQLQDDDAEWKAK